MECGYLFAILRFCGGGSSAEKPVGCTGIR